VCIGPGKAVGLDGPSVDVDDPVVGHAVSPIQIGLDPRSIRIVEGERISMTSVGGPSMPRSLTR
jgi:hypothetical protein